jgi:uracil-DNA glycosylase
MIVGQAPGPTGKDARRPFSGTAGRTLGTWLELAGFPPNAHHNPELVFLTSVTRCFPGKSSAGKGDRLPSATEVRLCRPYLDEEIALVQPRVVVALGRLAATELIGSAPLSQLIDQVIEVERAGVRFPVITLPHPSGVSRWLNDPANRAKHETALRRLGEKLSSWLQIRNDRTAGGNLGCLVGWPVLVAPVAARLPV